jgi:predicted ester cyclase
VLDKSDVAGAYVDFLHGDVDRFLALVADDSLDNVSGQQGPAIWRTVADWLATSFSDVEVDLHSVAEDDNGRILVWVTLQGTHIGSAFPWMAGRPATGRRVAHAQLHVFRIDNDRLAEHWAVRDDLRVLEAIDRTS